MDEKAIFQLCQDEGCCDGCCLRYLGLKHPKVYENIKESAQKYKNESQPNSNGHSSGNNNDDIEKNGADNVGDATSDDVNGSANDDDISPAAKKRKHNVCVSCLGILQTDNWSDSCRMVKEMLEKKRYECTSFACALSAPIATLLREKYLILLLKNKFPEYDDTNLTSLKEAWKWSFGYQLASYIKMDLDSGAVSPLLVTLNMEYPDEAQELEVLKRISPALFASRGAQRGRFAVEFTRRSAEQALQNASLEALQATEWRGAGLAARCVSVAACRVPVYLGGRYIKLSRTLPQTPWVLKGERMMESSVQEVIFEPIAKLYELTAAEAEHRLKFVAAGREDVDVRCLGDGRPFAIEISDPRRELTHAELQQACEEINKGKKVIVKSMVHITRDDLTELKKGEETKSKEYEALCIKLANSNNEKVDPSTPVTVTDADIERINSFTNTAPGDAVKIKLTQKTPIRVLHRRPLLTRERAILELQAAKVKEHSALFTVRLRTTAGTYVKEWAHGELRRTRPALCDALAAPADILLLDVTAVQLEWPPKQSQALK